MDTIQLNITVKNNLETLAYIKANQTSVARFGDGEIDILSGGDTLSIL